MRVYWRRKPRRTLQREMLAPLDTTPADHAAAQQLSAFYSARPLLRISANEPKVCRDQFDARIQAMFDAEAQARRTSAQSASDALDPFHFYVDLDCEDTPAPPSQSTAAAPAEEA